MRRIVLFIAFGIAAFTGESFSQTPGITNPHPLDHYDVMTNSSGPCVRVFAGGDSVDIQIDGTKFSEYILAALMVYPVDQLEFEVATNGTDTFYRFLVNWIADPNNPSTSDQLVRSTHVPANLRALGFCKKADGSLVFEIITGTQIATSSAGTWTIYPLTLSAGAVYEEKVQFDFVVSSVINYHDSGKHIIEVGGLNPIRVRFHSTVFTP